MRQGSVLWLEILVETPITSTGFRYICVISVVNQVNVFSVGYNMRNGYGICRGDELFALFVLGNQAPPMNAGPFSEFDHKNSAKLLKIWTDFATFGNPNERNCTENCLNWPPLTISKR